MNFRSIAQLSDQLLRWAPQLPRDIEVVAGVPRSGFLAASILSLYLNVPLTDINGLLEGRCFQSGARRRRLPGNQSIDGDVAFLSQPRRVLVLDDSVLNGRAMREAREHISAANLPHSIRYAAVYVSPGRESAVDFHCEVVNSPRVFEWNVFHGGIMKDFLVALDGVLCSGLAGISPTDEDRYLAAVRDAQPLVVPSTEIGLVLAARPERFRSETEAWLQRHQFRFRELLMLHEAEAALAQPGLLAVVKAQAYSASACTLFMEQSLPEALTIAQLSGRHVLCTSSMQLIHPGTVPLARAEVPVELHPLAPPSARERLAGFARRVLPEPAQDTIRQFRAWTRTRRGGP